MKKVLLFIAFFILTAGYSFSQGVIISEIVASPSGNYPKYVELTNTSNGEINLNGYTVNLYTNGNTSVYRHYTFASDFMLPSKASVVLTNMDNSTDGQKWSDFNLNTPNLVITSTVAYGNGNDVYELVDASDVIIDRYGDVGDDFTGEDWEYTRSYSYRRSTIHTPTPNFESFQWYCAGMDALVGHEDDLSPYLTPGTHTLTNSTGSLNFTYPAGGEDFNTGETVTITWTSSGINELLIQGKKSDEDDFETLTDDPVDATLGSLDLPVPTDAEEGDYILRLVCVEDPTLMSVSGVFHITDIHFGGLDDEYPFWPENGATGIPIALNDHKIAVYFNEPVQPGTGNAYLKKFSDNSIIKTFDASNPNDFFTNPNDEYSIMFDVGADLDPDTKYYYTISSTDENGSQRNSTMKFFNTLDVTPPTKVRNLKNGSITIDSVELNWDHVNVPDFNHYIIYRNNYEVTNLTETSHKDEDLNSGVTYTYQVSAVERA